MKHSQLWRALGWKFEKVPGGKWVEGVSFQGPKPTVNAVQ